MPKRKGDKINQRNLKKKKPAEKTFFKKLLFLDQVSLTWRGNKTLKRGSATSLVKSSPW